MATLTIEAALEQIARENGLTNVAVGFSSYESNGETLTYFSATVHWKGYSRRDLTCVGENAPTVREALYKAIAGARADRTPPEPQLPGAGETIGMPALVAEEA